MFVLLFLTAERMNEILDLFDEYIYRDNRVLKNAVSLLS